MNRSWCFLVFIKKNTGAVENWKKTPFTNLREQHREKTEGDQRKEKKTKKNWSKNLVLFHCLITFIIKSQNQHLRASYAPSQELHCPVLQKCSFTLLNPNPDIHNPIWTELKFGRNVEIKRQEKTQKQPPSCGGLFSSVSMPSFLICSRLREPEHFTFEWFFSSLHTWAAVKCTEWWQHLCYSGYIFPNGTNAQCHSN